MVPVDESCFELLCQTPCRRRTAHAQLRSEKHEPNPGAFDEIGERGSVAPVGACRCCFDLCARAHSPSGAQEGLKGAAPDPASTPCAPPDIQWVNGAPVSEPGTLWLDAYKASVTQGEVLLPPSNYTAALGRDTTLAAEFHTYTLDWQPGYITW